MSTMGRSPPYLKILHDQMIDAVGNDKQDDKWKEASPQDATETEGTEQHQEDTGINEGK
jgi:hypothetical protein